MAIQQTEHDTAPHQILDIEGNLIGKMPDLSAERLLSLYRFMQLGRAYSNKIIALQRQGRATTFGSLMGQEAIWRGFLVRLSFSPLIPTVGPRFRTDQSGKDLNPSGENPRSV